MLPVFAKSDCELIHREDHFTKALIRFVAFMSSAHLGPGKDLVDYWSNRAAGQQRHNLLSKQARSRRFLFRGASAQRSAHNLYSLPHHDAIVDFSFGSTRRADKDQ